MRPTVYEPAEFYEHLLRHGHCSVLESNADGPEAEAWLARALKWWEEIADRARADGLPIVSYRGWDEMGTYSAYTALLHPHSSLRLLEYREESEGFDLLGPEFRPSVMAVSRWRRFAATPQPDHLEPERRIDADYEQLARDGRVTGLRGPGGSLFTRSVDDYPDRDAYTAALRAHHETYRHSWQGWREAELIPWCEALTVRARRDGLSIFCEAAGTSVAHLLDEATRMPLTFLRDLKAGV